MDGWKYFDNIKIDYNINPTIEHYSCMVDLLGKAGFLDEALDFIRAMPQKVDTSIWGVVLAACKLHKDIKIAEIAARNLLRLEPYNSANYVLMMNIYSTFDRWGDVERLKESMTGLGSPLDTPSKPNYEVLNLVSKYGALLENIHPCFLKKHKDKGVPNPLLRSQNSNKHYFKRGNGIHCSSSKGCSARKQLERSKNDSNMLVITYTSEHNHPWPTQRNALPSSTTSQPSKHNNNVASNSKNSEG
ncbi:hypothetical protein JHK84_048001 [Glycine max]|nr:hypothetical protein JHK85_048583 [Glycine max]KAG5103032.1 hypothetical protein JHK84_048001 [Glycine max]